LMMRLISETRRELTHTETPLAVIHRRRSDRLTLFADQRVVAVVGVVGISCGRTAAIANHSEVKLCELVSKSESERQMRFVPRNSCPNLPEWPELVTISIHGWHRMKQVHTSTARRMARWSL
jgi:hypothetical protein